MLSPPTSPKYRRPFFLDLLLSSLLVFLATVNVLAGFVSLCSVFFTAQHVEERATHAAREAAATKISNVLPGARTPAPLNPTSQEVAGLNH